MTRSENRFLAGTIVFAFAATVVMCFCAWRMRDLDTRLRALEMPIEVIAAPDEPPQAQSPLASPAVVPDDRRESPTPKTENPKPRKYRVGKRESLLKPALLDGMTCWSQRTIWNEKWRRHNANLITHNRKRHRRHPKTNDYTVFPGAIIVLPTLEEVAHIKATTICKGGP
ncbi:MAG: hypothetical protein EXS55_01970 [Candidatus Magasanikbacteria bacterium]|nr:hypothetical protein [Candidatus Magasanikbacteria bacterium]